MAIFEGRLTEISEKHGKSKAGKPWVMYSLVVANAHGTHYLGTAFDKPEAPVGAIIRVEAAQKGEYWNADVSTLEVLKGEEAKSVNAPTQAAAVAAVTNKERSIVTQSSYKVAVEAVAAMLANGVITLPAKATKKGSPFEIYLETLDRVAEHIFNQCMNPFEVSDNTNEEEDTNEEEGEYDPLA